MEAGYGMEEGISWVRGLYLQQVASYEATSELRKISWADDDRWRFWDDRAEAHWRNAENARALIIRMEREIGPVGCRL